MLKLNLQFCPNSYEDITSNETQKYTGHQKQSHSVSLWVKYGWIYCAVTVSGRN